MLQIAGWEAATAHDFLESTREHWTALKALVLQLDPDEDGAEERIYRELERRGETALLRAFREQWRNLLPPNAEDMELDELMEYVNARLLQTPVIPDAVSRIIANGADAGVNVAAGPVGAHRRFVRLHACQHALGNGPRNLQRRTGEKHRRYDQAGSATVGAAMVRER